MDSRDRYGLQPALYSAKCFAGAMLALYVALDIGLPRPYWAVITAYVVSQPQAGAVRSKALYRVIGTIAGGAVTVLLIPPLVNAPELLSLALASWVGLCLYVSLLDRTPRAYTMLLAGYTAAIIGFPSVAAPGAIFDTAALRVQEITIGIISGTLIHGLVLPQSITGALLARVDRFLADAERWSADALTGMRSASLDRDRRRLASDVTELHLMATHLPFDTARLLPRRRTVRALQGRLTMLLPVAAAAEDRLALLQERGAVPEAVRAAIADADAWLRRGAPPAEGAALEARAAALEPEPRPGWGTALALSFVARLGEMIRLHRQLRLLREQLRSPDPAPVDPTIEALLAGPAARPLHRDRGLALRSAGAAIAGILLCCAIWIGTAWPEGAIAAMMTAVFCSLFAAFDDPTPQIRAFFIYTLASVPLSAIYLFAILPHIDGYPMLVAVMAPPLLILGALLASPATSLPALAMVLGLVGSIGFSERYSADFTGFINGALAQLGGAGIAFVTTRLLRTVGADWTATRLIRDGWRDVAALADGTVADVGGWTSRMLDRVGLLTPRLSAVRADERFAARDMLADLRVGLSVAELGVAAADDISPEARQGLDRVRRGVGDHYRALLAGTEPAHGDLLASIDAALVDPGSCGERHRMLALIGIRRNLFPDAALPVDRRVAA
ncbi:MAG TPA: FUSC family protein [Sphingomonas sp.]|nr:FUSC family protein [Sphingomonas sp.]